MLGKVNAEDPLVNMESILIVLAPTEPMGTQVSNLGKENLPQRIAQAFAWSLLASFKF